MKRFLVLGMTGLVLIAMVVVFFHLAGKSSPTAVVAVVDKGTEAMPGSGSIPSGSVTKDQTPGVSAAFGSKQPSLASLDGTNNPILSTSSAIAATPKPQKRAWDTQWIASLGGASEGDAIHFELLNGENAEGSIRFIQRQAGTVTYVTGSLTAPESGRFFFQKQTVSGNAGDFVGVVELPESQRAFRIEPSGLNGSPELVSHGLKDVLCLRMPLPKANVTNDAENIPPLNPSTYPANMPVPAYQNGILVLQSLPGASAVIYLDFQGGYTPTWGGITYTKPTLSNAQIFDVWKRVAERYEPFQVNITTDLGVFTNAPATSRQRCIISPTSTAAPGAGGVSYIGSFQWGGTPDTPNWVFMTSGKACAEAIVHECGHCLGLGHDGQEIGGTNHVEYYGGQGSGATGWAPIMGVGYDQLVVQWSKGEYQWANNHEDDLAIITANNNMKYRDDDTGETLATARYLEVYSNNTVFAEGVIETTGDTDAFQFTTTGGSINLTVKTVGDWGGLAILAALCDANEKVLVTNSVQTVTSATIKTNLPPGTYTFQVTGAGRNKPATTGFSSYASLGYYAISGTVLNGRQSDRFTIPENVANGTKLGLITANNPNNDPLVFTITSGNTGNTFAIDNDGRLSVADNSLLDYDALALSSQFPVQFEMFVDIVNATDSSLTELNHRVVVSITNVNEPPTLTGFDSLVLEHTQIGTLVGTATGSDPDFGTVLSYSIIEGNTSGVFSINSSSGSIRVAEDLNASTQSIYHLTVKVSDQTAPSPLTATAETTITIVPNNTPFQPGSVGYAVYTNLSGNLLTALTGSSAFPYNPALEKQISLFEGDSGRGDNYAAVIRGYLIPPTTGNYTFWIATDDNGELYLSNTTNPASMTRRAYISGNNNYASSHEWNKYASQKSALISLAGGQAYYIEARMKQGTGGDNFAVAWQSDDAGIAQDVIPGAFLAPFYLNYVPRPSGFSTSLHRDAITGSQIGTIIVSDVNTNDDHSFTIASGNSSGLFSIDPTSGIVRLADESAMQRSVQTVFNLSVRVSDNGTPARTATASGVITLVQTNVITATSLRQELWTNIGSGTAVSALTTRLAYPKRPDALRVLSTFDSGENYADNYGSRIRAWLTPTRSGSYTFFFASDDNGQLKFSVSGVPASATTIASVSDSTDYLQWNKFASQKSAVFALTAGKKYYLETLQKEAGGGDHVSVAWTGPGITGTNPIAKTFLTPVDLGFAPVLSGSTITLAAPVTNGTLVTTVNAAHSKIDPVAYKIVSGNSNDTFVIDSDSGRLTVANNAWITGGLVPGFTLQIQAQSSGYGDLYPRQSSYATFIVQLPLPEALVWTGNGTNADWSQVGNWDGTIPVEGRALTFSGTNNTANFNDQMNVAGLVSIENGGFVFTGNPLTLRAGLVSAGNNTWAIDSTFNEPQGITNSSGTLTMAGTLNIGTNLLILQANDALVVEGVISGEGGFTTAGLIVLNASNIISGPITVTAGKLKLERLGSISGSSLLDIKEDAVLDSAEAGGLTITPAQKLTGSGTLIGDVLVQGVLSPGDSIGTIHFTNKLTLSGVTLMEVNKNGSIISNDSIATEEAINMGGNLTVTNTGDALVQGDSVTLFRSPVFKGSFAELRLSSPGPGLYWDAKTLAVDGTLRVQAVPAPQLQVASLQPGKLQFQLQSIAEVNYLLQTTTNLVPPITWSNLSTNIGTGGLLTIPTAADSTQSQQFYRIMAY